MKNTILSLVFLLFSLFSYQCFAQYTYELDRTTRFEKMGADEGLSTMSVYCIHQDKYGFIWIGTQFGLNLYDGYEVKIFKSDPTDPTALLNDWITSIYEETDGTMWFCTNLGFSTYDRSTQTFKTYLPDTINLDNEINSPGMVLADGEYLWVSAWKNDLLRFNKKTEEFQSFAKNSADPSKGIFGANSEYIFSDNEGVLWVCSNEQEGDFVLSKFNKENKRFTHYLNDSTDPKSFAGKKVMSMTEDDDGTIWVATKGGGLLEIIDKETGKFRQYLHNKNDSSSIIHNYLQKVFKDFFGNIWVRGAKGFSFLDSETGQFTNYSIPHRTDFTEKSHSITDISEGLNGELWLSSRGGVFRFNPYTRLLTHFIKNPENKNSLTDNFSRQIITDRTGQTWIVLPNNGINKINRFSNVFRTIQMQDKTNDVIAGNSIDKFYLDKKGNFWFANSFGGDGLNRTRINKHNGYEDLERFFHDPEDPKSISGNRITTIYEDPDQFLWFGTWSGLNRYDYNTNSFTSFQFDPTDSTTISSNVVETIFEDSHGTFWVGTRNGLNIMDKAKDKFIRFLPDENDSNAILSNDIRAIFEDTFGELWVGGFYLEKFNRTDSSFVHYKPNQRDKSDVNQNLFRVIREDDSTNLWLASVYGGLYKMDRISQKFTVLNNNHGLPSNNIFAIEIDNNGFIWAASNQGLSRVDPRDYSVRNFDVADGLISLELTDRASYKDDKGWLYFGSMNGLNIFHPDSLKENKVIPPVYITTLNVAGKPKYFDKSLYELSNIELLYNENDFSFDFVALNYINPLKNQYAFMLEGYDADWNYVGNRRTAYYTNLSPGKYTFRVKGSNNDGYWNEEGANLGLIIHPPFWKTWWAYLIYTLTLMGLVYLFRRNELRKIKLRQDLELEQVQSEQLAKLDVEKNKFFSNISHEFRTPLTLILGPLDRFIDKLKNIEQKQELNLVRRNARRLQTLINQLLSLSKLESGKMKLRARPENIVKLTSLFLQSFHSMAEDRGIKLEFENDAEEYLIYIDTIKFEKVVNNLLSNAFKFTERGGEIRVSIQLTVSKRSGESRSKRSKHRDDSPQSSVNSPQFSVSSPQSSVSSLQSGNRALLTADCRLPTADCLQIEFSDTGTGISKEDLPHIFDRFYQVDETQMKTNLGTGIGLALTKELIELHHGTITAHSETDSRREEKGTTFTIFLPLGKDHLTDDEIFEPNIQGAEQDDELLNDDYLFVPNEPTGADRKVEKVVNGNLPLVLIVEDNEDMRTYIKSYLVNSYSIIEAINGKEGVEKAIEHIPDLIVSDLMMPKMDGNEMTILLKTDEKTSHIPIILLTAKASKESKLEGLETGADDFLTKPFDADELLMRIKNLIKQRQKLRDILSEYIGNTAQTRLIQKSSGKLMSLLDERFIEKATVVVQDYIASQKLNVEMLSREMAMSRMQLHRKLKSLTDNSPSEFIRNIRLIKASELLKQGELNVTQVSYEVGFLSLSTFAKNFKEKYGVNPSEYN